MLLVICGFDVNQCQSRDTDVRRQDPGMLSCAAQPVTRAAVPLHTTGVTLRHSRLMYIEQLIARSAVELSSTCAELMEPLTAATQLCRRCAVATTLFSKVYRQSGAKLAFRLHLCIWQVL